MTTFAVEYRSMDSAQYGAGSRLGTDSRPNLNSKILPAQNSWGGGVTVIPQLDAYETAGLGHAPWRRLVAATGVSAAPTANEQVRTL